MNHPTLQDTLNLCIKSHGQTNAVDKSGSTPYYWHLLRVMLRINNTHEDTLHVALLHDIIEDTNITMEDLKNLGYNQNILDSVFWCSKNMFKNLTFEKWMKKIGEEGTEDAIIVKLSDISDNMGFERMFGLMNASTEPIVRKKKGYTDLQKIIHKNVKNGLKLHGEMGVYKNYYLGWNLLLENSHNLKYLDNVFTGDFCHLKQLAEISKWIPKEEMFNYLKLNNINTWKISGELEEVYDKAGSKYLSLKIDNDLINPMQDFLKTKIDGTYIENQQNRDHYSFHVTHINVMSYGSLVKHNIPLDNLNKEIGNTFEFFVHGIGTAILDEKQTWFLIIENSQLNLLREEASIKPHDFHVTLGFKGKDIHRVCKDKTTQVYDNSAIWEHVVSNDLLVSNKSYKTNGLKY